MRLRRAYRAHRLYPINKSRRHSLRNTTSRDSRTRTRIGGYLNTRAAIVQRSKLCRDIYCSTCGNWKTRSQVTPNKPIRLFSDVGRSKNYIMHSNYFRRFENAWNGRFRPSVSLDSTVSGNACSGVPYPPVTLSVFQVQRWVISLTALFFYTIQNTPPPIPTGEPIHLITLPQEQSIPFIPLLPTHSPSYTMLFHVRSRWTWLRVRRQLRSVPH